MTEQERTARYRKSDVVRVVESSEYLSLVGVVKQVVFSQRNTLFPYLVELDTGDRKWFTENGLELVERIG